MEIDVCILKLGLQPGPTDCCTCPLVTRAAIPKLVLQILCAEQPQPLAAPGTWAVPAPSPAVLPPSPMHPHTGSTQQTKGGCCSAPSWTPCADNRGRVSFFHCNNQKNTRGWERVFFSWNGEHSRKKKSSKALQHCNNNCKENLTASESIHNCLFWQQHEQFTSL